MFKQHDEWQSYSQNKLFYSQIWSKSLKCDLDFEEGRQVVHVTCHLMMNCIGAKLLHNPLIYGKDMAKTGIFKLYYCQTWPFTTKYDLDLWSQETVVSHDTSS